MTIVQDVAHSLSNKHKWFLCFSIRVFLMQVFQQIVLNKQEKYLCLWFVPCIVNTH